MESTDISEEVSVEIVKVCPFSNNHVCLAYSLFIVKSKQ